MNTSFGQTLRNAREAKGLTPSQVAAQTRMLVQIVEEMENEDFHRIAAPIYGRGFVKLYAECVGLDPLPLVKEFMDIYEGRRAPIVRTRDVPAEAPLPETPAPLPEAPPPVPAPDAPPPPEPEPEPDAAEVSEPPETPVPEPPPSVRGLDLFEAPQPTAAEPPPAPAPRVPPAADLFATDSPYLTSSTYAEAEGPTAAERFRTGLSSVSHGVVQTVHRIPRSVWRITLLAVAAIGVVALLAWGCLALYRATTPPPRPVPGLDAPDAPPPAVQPAPKPAKPAAAQPKPAARPAAPAKPAALRTTGQKIPVLYVD